MAAAEMSSILLQKRRESGVLRVRRALKVENSQLITGKIANKVEISGLKRVKIRLLIELNYIKE